MRGVAGSRLTFRSTGALLLAYILSPIVSLSFIWVGLTIYDFTRPNYSFLRDVLILPWLFLVGGAFCFLVELLVVTPIALLFRRYRWSWLNGWFASGMGFTIGGIFWLLMIHREVWGASLFRLPLGEAILEISFMGFAGMFGALTFRFIAVEKV